MLRILPDEFAALMAPPAIAARRLAAPFPFEIVCNNQARFIDGNAPLRQVPLAADAAPGPTLTEIDNLIYLSFH